MKLIELADAVAVHVPIVMGLVGSETVSGVLATSVSVGMVKSAPEVAAAFTVAVVALIEFVEMTLMVVALPETELTPLAMIPFTTVALKVAVVWKFVMWMAALGATVAGVSPVTWMSTVYVPSSMPSAVTSHE
jgi:hypothetical protein